MAVIRKHTENQYTRIANETLRNTSLSWEATGMLAYLLSHSDQFKISVKSLSNSKKNGLNATRRILGELREAGYVHFSGVSKDDKGCWGGSIWDIFEEPQGRDPSLTPRVYNRIEDGEKDVKTGTADIGTTVIGSAVDRHALEETTKEELIKNKQDKVICDKSQKMEVEIVEKQEKSKKNVWVDVWMDFMGVEPSGVSGREWKEIHKANKEIREMGADIEALKLRMAQYSLSKTFSKCERTPNAIMRHWSRLGRAEDVSEHLGRERSYMDLAQQFIDSAGAVN